MRGGALRRACRPGPVALLSSDGRDAHFPLSPPLSPAHRLDGPGNHRGRPRRLGPRLQQGQLRPLPDRLPGTAPGRLRTGPVARRVRGWRVCGDVPGARARPECAGRGPAPGPRCQLARGGALAPAAGHPLRADGPRAGRGGRPGRGGGGAALGRVPGVRPVRLRARHPARRLHRRCHGLGGPPPGPGHLRHPPRGRTGGGTPPRPGPVRRGPPEPGGRGEPPGVELAPAHRGRAAARGGVGGADRPRPPGRGGRGARPRRVHGRREVERPGPRRDADRHRPRRHHRAGPPRALGPPALRRLGAQDRGPGRRAGRPAAAPPAGPARRPPAPPRPTASGCACSTCPPR